MGLGAFPSTAYHRGEFFLAENSLINQRQWGADRWPLSAGPGWRQTYKSHSRLGYKFL